jgi:hypothetical protein
VAGVSTRADVCTASEQQDLPLYTSKEELKAKLFVALPCTDMLMS